MQNRIVAVAGSQFLALLEDVPILGVQSVVRITAPSTARRDLALPGPASGSVPPKPARVNWELMWGGAGATREGLGWHWATKQQLAIRQLGAGPAKAYRLG